MDNTQKMRNDAETLLRFGSAVGVPRSPVSPDLDVVSYDTKAGIPYIVIPGDYVKQDLESLLPAPARKRGTVTVSDSESFIYYAKKHGSLDECTVYADIDSESYLFHMVAIINDHGSDIAQWRDHRCELTPKLSVEWKRWAIKNKALMPQSDFAAWLEDNLADVANVEGMPTGADILSMALGFEANRDKRLRSKINLQSGGVSLEFVDTENDQTRTTMKFFERFTLGIPVFDGSTSAYPLEARLKYREASGKLSFWYELIRPDRVFKQAVIDETTRVKETTGFPLLAGKPE